MNTTQNQIKRTLSQPDHLDVVRRLLDANREAHRTELALRVCEHFGFYDLRGRPQQAGCAKALRQLERQGHLRLPEGRSGSRAASTPRCLPEPVPEPEDPPTQLHEITGLDLVLVQTPQQLQTWNSLMTAEHPQGAGPLVGRQVRYLIASDAGWLGGLGFAAPALHLADRDAWIGWTSAERAEQLHYLVCMSRFLLRSSVSCPNLASKVLSLSVTALPEDFAQAYGYRPLLLESFVDTERFSGTCYRAANWIEVGMTQGRGRQDRAKQAALSRKAIFVYPLVADFRRRLGLSPRVGGGALSPSAGLTGDDWVNQEFGNSPLGDARLSRRLVQVAAAKAKAPDQSFSQATGGDWPEVKAYYRLMDHAAATPAAILAPHNQQTLRRMQGQKIVLCVQDGSDLNYNSLANCSGLGVIGSNQTGAKSRGLHLHSTLALSPSGLPLGVVRADCQARKANASQDQRPSHKIPREEKKSFIWVAHFRHLVEQAKRMPQTRLISVCDREADFFDLFDEQRQQSRVELLVRAKHNRALLGENDRLFETLRQAPAVTQLSVSLPRQSARPKQSKQKAKPARAGRQALLSLRSASLSLRPPSHQKDKAPITLQVVHAREEQPPANAEPVEWFLLTTLPMASVEDLIQCLRWYQLRWRIEDWHRVLKSGCRIEDLAHASAERLRRAIAINLVIAWRIMLMTLLGRETPALPAEVLFTDIEISILRAYAKKTQKTA
jgi:hypothetical protein